MIRLPVRLALVFIASASFAAEPVPLFNGQDLTGWRAPEPNPWWSVENGVLVGHEDAALKGHTLRTEKEFGNVAVEAEVRWNGKIDSGIFLRKDSQWQCQIGISGSLKRDMTCSIYVPKGGYVVRADPAKVDRLLKPGDWNKIRLEARGDHYKITLNGEVVVDEDLPGFSAPGPVALQIHAGLKMRVEFRHLTAQALE